MDAVERRDCSLGNFVNVQMRGINSSSSITENGVRKEDIQGHRCDVFVRPQLPPVFSSTARSSVGYEPTSFIEYRIIIVFDCASCSPVLCLVPPQ